MNAPAPEEPIVIHLGDDTHTIESCKMRFDNLSRFTGEPILSPCSFTLPLVNDDPFAADRAAQADADDDGGVCELETAWTHACVNRFDHAMPWPGREAALEALRPPKVETTALGVESIEGITIFDPSVLLGFSDMGVTMGLAERQPFLDQTTPAGNVFFDPFLAQAVGPERTAELMADLVAAQTAVANQSEPRAAIQTTGYLQVVGEMPSTQTTTMSGPFHGDPSCGYYRDVEVEEGTPDAVMSIDGLGGVRWFKAQGALQPGDKVKAPPVSTDTSWLSTIGAGLLSQTRTQNTLQRHFLAKDHSGDWYVVDASRRKDWELYLELCDDDCILIPNFATRVTAPDAVEFSSWSPAP